MSSGYPAPHMHHPQFQPEMGAPPPHHPGYSHNQLPPPISSNTYYQDPMTNPHRSLAMPPPRVNMAPPNMSGSRERAGELGGPENGMGGQPPNSLASQPASEEKTKSMPLPIEGNDGHRKYRLEVVQQPLRARMCGFGDKDRRPITPPPCIRLVVMDRDTGKEVDCNEVEHQHYVLHVDLWSEDGYEGKNLVKHSQQSPSISSTQASSFREVVEGGQAGAYAYQAIVPSNRDFAQPPNGGYPHQMPYQQDPYSQGKEELSALHTRRHDCSQSDLGQYGYPQQIQPYGYPQGGYRDLQGVVPSQQMYTSPRFPHDMPLHTMSQNRMVGTQTPNGMYTRNLIGSLAASGSRLTDPHDKIGIWFILQDLSVRTEGWFRLRFSFINVRRPGPIGAVGSDAELLNRGRAPILAQVFSEKFQVYSAKKFPGVCESTALSKCFAQQGVKIPIRKDGQDGKAGKGREDSVEDE
ncbi:Uu.00g045060.m01.CDS01 [Anthostomella pinea]|uniref:Uu.00g045060.m01.CDS01 n=1 Tax=Anthostomella pinea TaxID=933095 RepID=A0AAI8V617_9PEZI|nr:Uu.00g045060.m01.CDS01 [Anthostomella pinea]